MRLEQILLLTDKADLAFSYEILLHPYEKSKVVLLSKRERLSEIDLSGYYFIIADLSQERRVREFLELCDFYAFTRESIVLISPYESRELERFAIPLKKLSFIIKKPFLTSKLTTFIDKEMQKLKQVSLISSRADILIDIFDLHPSRIAVYESDGSFFYANAKYAQAYSISYDLEQKLHFDDITSCDCDFDGLKSKLFMLKSFSSQIKEHGVWYEHLFFYTNTKYVIHTVSDITVQKDKELRLQLASSFFENTNEGIIIANENVEIESVNSAFCAITGYTQDEVLGKNPRFLKSGIHDEIFYKEMWQAIKVNGYWKGEIWNKRKNADIYPQMLSISKTANTLGEEKHYMAILSDMTSLKKADEKIYYHANYDSLTKLPNRAYFVKQLENILKESKENETQVAIFFIDVDKFKDVNDTYGHDVGDEMLITIAKRLQNSIREGDFLARIGGDEFVLIAKNIKNQENTRKLSLKIQKKIKERIDIDGVSFFMTLSLGVAIYPEHAITSQTLLKNADIAMYEVKESGRDNFKIYTESMSEKIINTNAIKVELKNALKRREFVMHYQPVLDFKSGDVVSAEALVRWNHPIKGLLAPESFLNFIFNTELEKEFGDLVIELVLKDLQKINAIFKGNKLIIAINISREHFFTQSFCSDMAGMIKEYNIAPSQVELEILETQLMHNVEQSKENIKNLRTLGIAISLDDFGVEYSSLNYLKEFDINKLKIDRSFIQNIDKDVHDHKITESIINIAKVFDLKIQAEGVETQKQYEKLKELGCDLSQGYLHSRPIGFEEFIWYYKKSTKIK